MIAKSVFNKLYIKWQHTYHTTCLGVEEQCAVQNRPSSVEHFLLEARSLCARTQLNAAAQIASRSVALLKRHVAINKQMAIFQSFNPGKW